MLSRLVEDDHSSKRRRRSELLCSESLINHKVKAPHDQKEPTVIDFSFSVGFGFQENYEASWGESKKKTLLSFYGAQAVAEADSSKTVNNLFY